MILYLTHALLDSDRTLHLGEYYPIWLLEEPESFMHTDLLSKLSKRFSSREWLSNIQMVVSTHSAIVLATSRAGEEDVRWNIMGDHELKSSRKVIDVSEEDIHKIGSMMGDSNFYEYFVASHDKDVIFIEDSRKITVDYFVNFGIEITQAMTGNNELKKYLTVYESNNFILRKNAYFIIDGDNGKNDFTKYLADDRLEEERNGFKKFKVAAKVFLIVLPENEVVEDMFNDYLDFVEGCVDKICDLSSMKIRDDAPTIFSGTTTKIKGHFSSMKNKDDLVKLIRNEFEVKHAFWKAIAEGRYHFIPKKINSLKQLIGL